MYTFVYWLYYIFSVGRARVMPLQTLLDVARQTRGYLCNVLAAIYSLREVGFDAAFL